MFNMGFTEMLFLAGLALVLIGPKQLPEVARTLGRFMNELRRSTSILTDEIKSQAEVDRRAVREKEQQKIVAPNEDEKKA